MSSAARGRVPALLPLLFGAILVLAGVLAYEAISALRQREAAAVRTLRDYATIAAWELGTRVRDRSSQAIREILEPMTGSPASSPYDRLPPIEPMRRMVDSLLPCGGDPGAGPSAVFRLDLRDGALVSDVDLPGPERTWLADTIARDLRAGSRPDQRFALLGGVPGAPDRVLVYGMKRAQFGAFAQPGAPIGAFGFLHCRSAFGAVLLRRVLHDGPLLPVPVNAGLPNDSLLLVTILGDAPDAGRADSGAAEDAMAREVSLGPPSHLRVRVALRPSAIPELAVAAPGAASRLPWLLGLLAVATGLGLVGLLQLRREEELSRLRSDFTSSVSHELKTPLAQILLSGETLALERTRSPEERAAAAGQIVQEARRLLGMVENVLSFARLERGVHALDPRPARAAPLLRGILTPWLPTVEGRVRVATALDESAWLRVDAGALTQVLHNLLDNAVKYGPAGQTVTVLAVREDPMVRISVDDEGPGVPEEDRLRIWDPFVRGGSTGRPSPGGTGLGLAVVRELILAQGGAVSVETGARGGARFTVTLPAAEPVLPEEARPTPTPSESMARAR